MISTKEITLKLNKILKPIYFDEEERKIYQQYLVSGPMVIEKRAEYDKEKKAGEVDDASLVSSYYSFINPIYKDKDFKKIDEFDKKKKEDIE